MLYELIAVVSVAELIHERLLINPGSTRKFGRSQRVCASSYCSTNITNIPIHRIVRTTANLILSKPTQSNSSPGVIRSIQNWGVSALPKRTRKHQAVYTEGHYFVIRYDASSTTQDQIRMTLGLDPRMIKFSNVKIGDGTLASSARAGTGAAWGKREMDGSWEKKTSWVARDLRTLGRLHLWRCAVCEGVSLVACIEWHLFFRIAAVTKHAFMRKSSLLKSWELSRIAENSSGSHGESAQCLQWHVPFRDGI